VVVLFEKEAHKRIQSAIWARPSFELKVSHSTSPTDKTTKNVEVRVERRRMQFKGNSRGPGSWAERHERPEVLLQISYIQGWVARRAREWQPHSRSGSSSWVRTKPSQARLWTCTCSPPSQVGARGKWAVSCSGNWTREKKCPSKEKERRLLKKEDYGLRSNFRHNKTVVGWI